jgi:hypothetical protein
MVFHDGICLDDILQFLDFVHVIALDVRLNLLNAWNFNGNRFVSRCWLLTTFQIALDNRADDFKLASL